MSACGGTWEDFLQMRRRFRQRCRMRLGIINSAFQQVGMDTATGLKHISRIGFDCVDIFTEAMGIAKDEIDGGPVSDAITKRLKDDWLAKAPYRLLLLWFEKGGVHSWEALAGAGRVIAVEVKAAATVP